MPQQNTEDINDIQRKILEYIEFEKLDRNETLFST